MAGGTYDYDDGENIGHELPISPPHLPSDVDCSWRCSSFVMLHTATAAHDEIFWTILRFESEDFPDGA